jgi:hypothetical protein
MIAKVRRLAEDASRERNWKRWGPYFAERQWATVREDYSPHGTAWEYFPHDHARRRRIFYGKITFFRWSGSSIFWGENGRWVCW